MSAIPDSHATPLTARANPFSVRAYLAGSGATTALIAAAVIAFLTIAALVAFNGLPFGDGNGSGEAGIAELPAPGAPENAAVALGGGGASGAVAASPAAESAVAPAPGAASESSGGGDGSATIASGRGDDFQAPIAPPSDPGAGGAAPGALGGTVDNLEQSAGNLGLDLPLGEVTQGVTGPVDRTLNQTLNNVGGALGNPNLGDQVSGGVNNLTGKVNDLTGNLLR